jgi:predicted O-methyltransferase YrrM
VTGVQRFTDRAATHPRLTSAFLQRVGVKGHDGLAICVVR